MTDTEKSTREVAVGFDGSPHSATALRWAMAEARRRQLPLRIIVVWAYPYFGDVPIGLRDKSSTSIEVARQLLDATIAMVKEEWPEGSVDGTVVEGSPGPALVESASHSVLIVVGARGAGGFSRLLLGSVSDYVLRRASCPVAIIRDRENVAEANTTPHDGQPATPAVVVGLDGSASSLAALRWGADAARGLKSPLLIVAAWHFPMVAGPGGMASPIPWFDVETETKDLVARVRAEEVEALAGLTVDVLIREGSAARILLEASADAELLVIGDHARKGLGRLLGSVASQCAHHAPCPLVVMRDGTD